MIMFVKLGEWYRQNERRLGSAALLLGFIIDNFTLTRIDQLFDNIILLSYLTFAATGIVVIHLYEAERFRGWFADKIVTVLPLFIQFAFGGLFSGYFIFYSRSASLAESWFFLVILLGLLIANESFKQRYLRFGFQIGIFYMALFSFLIFYVPILVKSIAPWAFVLAGVTSLVLITLFLKLLARISANRIVRGAWPIRIIIASIFTIINVMYFTNIIPPIPLSLKDAGVFHYVENTQDGRYIVLQEQREWWEVYKRFKPEIHLRPGQSAYFYNAVFSPTDLNANIVHSWQYHDADADEWKESFNFTYKIVGGREGGYRGYSIKEQIWPGKWRVDVMTEREQLLGRYTFEVKGVDESVGLETVVR